METKIENNEEKLIENEIQNESIWISKTIAISELYSKSKLVIQLQKHLPTTQQATTHMPAETFVYP